MIPAAFFSLFSVLIFDGGTSIWRWIEFLVINGLTVATLVSIPGMWISYRRRKFNLARLFALLPWLFLLGTCFVPGLWNAGF